jgi:hypothetical protein
VDHTYCYRCGKMMAAIFPVCPHCGAPQDEQSRAKGRRRNKVVYLTAIPAGLLGLLACWLLEASAEWIFLGFLVGAVVGVVIVLPLYDRARKKEERPPASNEEKPQI